MVLNISMISSIFVLTDDFVFLSVSLIAENLVDVMMLLSLFHCSESLRSLMLRIAFLAISDAISLILLSDFSSDTTIGPFIWKRLSLLYYIS